MKHTCPHCNEELSFKTRFGLHNVRGRSVIGRRRKCPKCNNWFTKKPAYALYEIFDFLIIISLSFFKNPIVQVLLLLIVIVSIPMIIDAPLIKAKVIYPDGYGRKIVEGKEE